MTDYGYARYSTVDQRALMQRSELAHAGLHEKNIFVDEAIGGKFASRPQLDKMLNKLKQGDTVTVYRLDRIGRTLSNEQKQLAYQLAYGGQTITSIARVMKCSRSTVYRALREEVQSGVERLSRTCCVVRWVQSRRPQQVCLHVTYRGRSEWLTA